MSKMECDTPNQAVLSLVEVSRQKALVPDFHVFQYSVVRNPASTQ